MPQALAPRWAAHKSRYGSIPAPFHVSSGSVGGLAADPAEIPVCWLTQPLTLRLDRPFNYAEVTQVDGSTARYTAPGATVIYPFYATLTTAVDADPSNLAHWTVTYNSTPRTRSPSLTINLLHRTDAEKAFLLGIGRNRRIRLTGLPVGWPTGADTLVVRGIQHQAATYTRTVTWVTGPVIGAAPTAPGLLLTGVAGSYGSTPDDAALDIVGDIDIRADVTMDWSPTTFQTLVAKYTGPANLSYRFGLVEPTGLLQMVWSTTGAAGGVVVATATVATTPGPGNRLAARATVDVDNGAAGSTTTFYTATTIAGPWTQLGAPVINAGVTSIFSGSAILEVGTNSAGTLEPLTGTVHAVEVRNGIDGTVVANPNFLYQPTGTTAFVDSAGRAWTVNGTAQIFTAQAVPGPWFRWGTSSWGGTDTRPF